MHKQELCQGGRFSDKAKSVPGWTQPHVQLWIFSHKLIGVQTRAKLIQPKLH